MEQLDDARLDEPIVPGFTTVYLQLHGTVQHDLYHGGQIMLLARAARGESHGS
jgi:hypothetical protein